MSHSFTVVESSDYDVQANERKYRVSEIVQGGLTPNIKVGELLTLESIGRIVANGHEVIMHGGGGK